MSSQYPILDNRPIDQWKVTELKEELRRRKLTTKGLKEDLVKRLHESILIETEPFKEDELDNGSSSDSIQQDMHNDVHVDPVGDAQIEKSSLESIQRRREQTDGDSAVVDDNNSHQDVTMADQIDKDKDSVESVGHEGIVADSNVLSVEQDDADAGSHEIKAPTEKPVSTDELVVAAEEAIPSETFVLNDGASDHSLQSGPSIPDSVQGQGNENPQCPIEDAFDPFEPNNPEVKHHSISSSSPSQLEPESQEPICYEPDNITKPPSEDVMREPVVQNNQVSEVKPNLGFQVSSELISSDSLSINKKNELKDNLNANDFPLELEVIKPEMVHSSSSDVAPVGGDLQPLDTVHEPGLNLGPSEEIDVTVNAKDGNLGKKIDSADVGYPEKLNLDRSSGEESMEEDVLETKQIVSNTKPDEVEDNKFVSKLLEDGSHMDARASRSSLEDILIQEESVIVVNAEKRKLEAGSDTARVNEPSKRQRRWNSEPIKVSEHPPSNFTPSSTPKASVQQNLKRSFPRSDPVVSGDSLKERIVPPSQKSPTTSLRIDRFLRPFTLKSVQELLGKTGTLCSFWMDNIKTHCYVTYSSEEEAVATRNAVYNLQWPPNGGRLLVAEFVDPQEVKLRIEAPPESPVPIIPSPKTPSGPPQSQSSQHPVRQHGLKQQLPPPPPLPPLPPPPVLADPPISKERQQLPPPPQKKPEPPKPEKPILTLDDLFMKTKATPRIYYLPLSEEQVAAKRAAQAKATGN